MKKIIVAIITLFTSLTIFAQSDLEKLRNDIVHFTYDYIDPAADLSINIAQNLWASDTKVNDKFKLSLSAIGNHVFVGNKNKTILLKNSEYEILSIVGGQQTVDTATILGGVSNVQLAGVADLLGNGTYTSLLFYAPDGMGLKSISTYNIQSTIGLGFNTDVILRYIPKTKVDEVINKGFGFGLKHNISRWFDSFAEIKMDLAILLTYANFNISNDILFEIQGEQIDRSVAEGNTYDFGILTSKNIKNISISGGLHYLINNYTPYFEGADTPLLKILNDGLAANSKSATSFKVDLGATYQYKKMDVYTNFTYSKFPSITLGFNYNL